LERVSVSRDWEIERAHDRLKGRLWYALSAQIDEERAVAERFDQLGCGLQRKSGLAGAARSRDREQLRARRLHECLNRRELCLPPEELGGLQRQIARSRIQR